MKVRSITRVDRKKENGETTMYKMVARDKDGVNEVTFNSAQPFEGLSPTDGVIQLVIKNSQKPLSSFQKPETRGRKKKEDEAEE